MKKFRQTARLMFMLALILNCMYLVKRCLEYVIPFFTGAAKSKYFNYEPIFVIGFVCVFASVMIFLWYDEFSNKAPSPGVTLLITSFGAAAMLVFMQFESVVFGVDYTWILTLLALTFFEAAYKMYHLFFRTKI